MHAVHGRAGSERAGRTRALARDGGGRLRRPCHRLVAQIAGHSQRIVTLGRCRVLPIHLWGHLQEAALAETGRVLANRTWWNVPAQAPRSAADSGVSIRL